ncbi:uncharacterized protein WM294_000522 isoform 1-T1 [Sarcoramphus papa]
MPSTVAPSAWTPSPGRPGAVPSWMSRPSPTSRRREWTTTWTRRRRWHPKGSEMAEPRRRHLPGCRPLLSFPAASPCPPPCLGSLCAPPVLAAAPAPAPWPSLHPVVGWPPTLAWCTAPLAPPRRWGFAGGPGAAGCPGSGIHCGAGAVEVAGPLHVPLGLGAVSRAAPGRPRPSVLPQ